LSTVDRLRREEDLLQGGGASSLIQRALFLSRWIKESSMAFFPRKGARCGKGKTGRLLKKKRKTLRHCEYDTSPRRVGAKEARRPLSSSPREGRGRERIGELLSAEAQGKRPLFLRSGSWGVGGKAVFAVSCFAGGKGDENCVHYKSEASLTSR